MFSLQQIRQVLHHYQPERIPQTSARQAAVAMLLCEGCFGPELLFIRRSDYDGDPWSGDVAFPGGGLEEQDAGLRQAAERETWEEIGLQLSADQYLGQLDDLQGAYLPVQISCFVYELTQQPRLRFNDEVVDSFWIPLQELCRPERNQLSSFAYRGETRSHQIIRLENYCDHYLWGISYRLLQSFLGLLETD